MSSFQYGAVHEGVSITPSSEMNSEITSRPMSVLLGVRGRRERPAVREGARGAQGEGLRGVEEVQGHGGAGAGFTPAGVSGGGM
ncbi:hypothetical protein GCM10008960_24250 [Deinococcus sedimenti]|uniref:Uncharacterized protein n=1 Tax=Deinococcus sedimenti TaxID=1867090 RepID=A0ABQ2S7C0_9DEIO|nr:hypothetical protein GCM10008960_24250 [Deinococcus sedimenti]